jgi:AcrR family transcriptional regulator
MPTSDRPYASVWDRPPRPERSTLTRDRIVTEALRLLDTEGIEALSMRKLAGALGAGTTSLYWHVANRDELIELVIDEIHGEIEVPAADEAPDWQEATRILARRMRATMVDHRWIVSVLDHLVASYMGPNGVRITEQALAMLEAAGFELREAERAMNALTAYVLGVAMSEAAWRNWLDRRGQTEEDWARASGEAAGMAVGDLPRLREVLEGYRGMDPQKMLDADFEYGLDRVLDGLRARLDAG